MNRFALESVAIRIPPCQYVLLYHTRYHIIHLRYKEYGIIQKHERSVGPSTNP